ncbi:MAG: NAD(P)-dependent oxidoreductase [Myxococcota bacterium]
MSTKTIAVLGLGAMGSRMAARLVEAGHSVRVWNRTAARAEPLVAAGATAAATPREAADGADVVVSMVRDDAASEQVWLHPETGATAALGLDALAVECSTLSPGWVARLGEALPSGRFLDAPVVGTRPQAVGGTLVFLVGGSDAPVSALGPVFDVLGGAVHHLGPLGRGTAMKLAVNALFGIQVAALAELLGTLARGGIEASAAMDVLGSLAVCSPAAKGTGSLMAAKRYDPLFPVELIEKYFGYAVEASEAAGLRAPVAAAARGVFAQAKDAGLGAENLVAVAKLYG